MLFLTAQCILNRSSLCCVDNIGNIYRPKVDSVTDSSVTLSFRPPEGSSSSNRVVVYNIRYIGSRNRVWKTTGEFRGLRRTVTDLDVNARYSFCLQAKFQGGSTTVRSPCASAQTKGSKCAVLLVRERSALNDAYCQLGGSANLR